MTTLTPTPKQQFLDANGNPLVGGKVYTYAAGTTTPLTTYTDEGGSTPNTNPVILDSRGEAAIWLGVASYKLKLTTSTDVEIWTVDNIVSASVQALANLSESGGSALVGYLPAGTGAVATTVQAKLRQTVSVKDFGAVGDGTTNDTVAIKAAITAADKIYFPDGVYLVTEAIQILGNKTIYGDGKDKSVIKKLTTNSEIINGITTVAVLFVAGRYNNLTNFGVSGETTQNNGIVFGTGASGIFSNSRLEEIKVATCKRGLQDVSGVYMTSFNGVICQNCDAGFDFSIAVFDTSLTFTGCWAENCGQSWDFNQSYYTVLNACGTDYGNYTSTGNPYGTGYGSRSTGKGIYHVKTSQIVFNGCGAENSYGNGVFHTETNSDIVINSCFSNNCYSEFIPIYGTYPNYAVGPVQTGIAANSIVLNSPRLTWSNTVVPVSYPTKPIAGLVAFNYVGAVVDYKMVSVTSTRFGTTTMFAGQGDVTKYCASNWSFYDSPTFVGVPTIGNAKYVAKTLSGSGTVITIPFVSQGSANQKHRIRVSGRNGLTNSNLTYPISADIGVASLTSLANVSSANLFGVSSVTVSSLNLLITVPASLTNPTLQFEVISENFGLIDFANMTIA